MSFTSWTSQRVLVLYAKLIVFALVLWPGTLVLGALRHNDDFLILLVCRPRPLIGRHLKKGNMSVRDFCGTKFLHDIAALLEWKMISPACFNELVLTTHSQYHVNT